MRRAAEEHERDRSMTGPSSTSGRAGLACLFVAGLGLRSAILVVGPLAPQIAADLSLSHTLTGLLSTLPLVMMGVAAVVAGQVTTSLGYRLTLGGCLLVTGLAAVLRAFAPEIGSMLLLTVPIGIGIGIASVA